MSAMDNDIFTLAFYQSSQVLELNTTYLAWTVLFIVETLVLECEHSVPPAS